MWFRVQDNHGRLLHGDPSIHIKLHYTDITRDENWSQGITSKFTGVPCTFFRQREGCKVTLYQDCHVPDHFNPRITLDGVKYYEAQQRCWEDIFDAITNARHLIYISGWSLYTEITSIRDPRRQKPGGGVTVSLSESFSGGRREMLEFSFLLGMKYPFCFHLRVKDLWTPIVRKLQTTFAAHLFTVFCPPVG